MEKRAMRPVLDGDYWMIGDNPDLRAVLGVDDRGRVQEVVDHHIFRGTDGFWHLWACIRGTAVGRVLYHWKAEKLTDTHWEQTGEMIRADEAAGENQMRWRDEEWLQSPYVVKENGLYYMFYGGHSTEWDTMGKAAERMGTDYTLISTVSRGQIGLMTSLDGLTWTRHLNRKGQSRLFMGPGESRDPMLLKIDGLWHLYVAGASVGYYMEPMAQIYLRTSEDLLHWSDWIPVHHDHSISQDQSWEYSVWSHECPFVAERAGYFYLFRTEDYGGQLTHVYRSEDPADFGLGHEAAKEKYVGIFPVGAPEIIVDEDGTEYISSSHNLQGGVMLAKMRWE